MRNAGMISPTGSELRFTARIRLCWLTWPRSADAWENMLPCLGGSLGMHEEMWGRIHIICLPRAQQHILRNCVQFGHSVWGGCMTVCTSSRTTVHIMYMWTSSQQLMRNYRLACTKTSKRCGLVSGGVHQKSTGLLFTFPCPTISELRKPCDNYREKRGKTMRKPWNHWKIIDTKLENYAKNMKQTYKNNAKTIENFIGTPCENNEQNIGKQCENNRKTHMKTMRKPPTKHRTTLRKQCKNIGKSCEHNGTNLGKPCESLETKHKTIMRKPWKHHRKTKEKQRKTMRKPWEHHRKTTRKP